MTDSNYRHVVLVVDRSGSMASILDEAQAAVSSFLKELRGGKGRTTVTLREFDDEHNVVYDFAELDRDLGYLLTPRGMTALNDAIGMALSEAGERLNALPEEKRPSNVTFVVVTDGYENASKEYSQEKIREMIIHQRDVYGWTVVYLSADPTAKQQAQGYGIPMSTSAVFDLLAVNETTGTTAANLNTAWNTATPMSYSSADRARMSTRSGATTWEDADS